MKKILIILSIILLFALIGFGVFYFFGNGKEKVANFFSDNTFGSFFDTEPQSRNDFIDIPIEVPSETPQEVGPYQAPVLRQLSFEPISGYTSYSTTSTSTRVKLNSEGQEITEEYRATSTVVRFQERATGHIYDVFEFIEAPQKVSNVTQQKIYSTLFSNNKDMFVYQAPTYNYEQIQSTLGTLSFSTTTGVSLDKKDISSSVSDFVFNKYANKLIYSIKQSGVSTIMTSNIDRTNEKAVTTLYFNDFVLDPLNKDEVTLTTKASQAAPGYAYILNATTGSLTKILGNIPGLLVKVSPDKKYYLYSQSERNRPSLRSYNTQDKTTSILTIDTLPSEKCVFSQKNTSEAYCFGSLIYKSAQYPDDWYKGKLLNNEILYKIDLTNNFVSNIYTFDPEELGFDTMNIQIINKDQFIVFQNKRDLTLWSIDLSKLSNEL